MSYNLYRTTNKRLSKRNFSEVLESLIPSLYLADDIAEFGKADDLLDTIINSHITIASNISQILDVSNGSVFSGIDDGVEGIFPFFLKQNTYNEIKPYNFFRNLLIEDEKNFSDFATSSAFVNYLVSGFIPKIETNSPTLTTHDNLIENLGWFYFLASGNSESVQPSSLLPNYLVKLYRGESIGLNDGINCLTEYLWYNQTTFSAYIPTQFLSGTATYTSGTQQLQKLKTLNNIIYSNEYFDRSDFKVYEAFDQFVQLGNFSPEFLSNGPFWRLIKSFSFAFADMQNETDKLQTLYDLQDCPDELLQEIAYLIGWKLLGSDPNKWRLQLFNAVDLYKRAGTKQSIQAAVNLVFTEGVVDIASDIIELWESYLPFLAMYALATESYLFKSYDTWTRPISNQLKVDKYDIYNFENNIRLAVDRILLTLYEKHPDSFKIGGRPFKKAPFFRFNYRGREYPIPPFEEIPYYLSCEITQELVTDLVDELVCFGVRPAFADQVGEYILDNTLRATDEIREENSWLMFASGMSLPPNFDSLLSVIGDESERYLSLWNGKSSHYYLAFRASDFDFTKVTYEANSKQVILIAAEAAKQFAPAHAIANFKVVAEDSEDYYANGTMFMRAFIDDYESLDAASSSLTIANTELSGVDFLGGDGEVFSGLGRNVYDTLLDSCYTDSSSVTTLRNSFRRRNYRSTLNIAGYYDRTGFNPPIFLDSAIRGLQVSADDNLISLGFIPSSLSYVSAFTDAECSGMLSSINPILDRCNTKDNSSYFGYFTSGTLKTRGYNSIDDDVSGSTMYLDRGDLDPFMYVIYKIEEEKIKRVAQKIVEDNYEIYVSSLNWKNVSGSIANSLLSCEPLLSSLDEYRNYTFGQKIHRLFNIYTSGFNNHGLLGYDQNDLNKANILVHCFGSILDNSDLSERGSYDLFASSLDSATRLTLNSIYFSGAASAVSAYGTFTFTESSSLVASCIQDVETTVELVNSAIMNNVELVHTSGVSNQNEFTLYDIQTAKKSYAFNNPLIKLKSINGLPRIRFTIKGSDLSETYGQHRDNSFLHPEHNYKLSIKGLAALDDGSLLTNSKLGVWIHTKAEVDDTKATNYEFSWHFNKNKQWELVPVSKLTKTKILQDLTHFIAFDDPDIGEASSLARPCRAQLSGTVDRSLTEFNESYFSTKEIVFNTLNKCMNIIQPEAYYRNHGQVHRFDQTYYVEIFMIPTIDNTDKFILLDEISLRNETLWDYTRIELDPDLIHTMTHPLCSNKKLDLSPDDIRTIIRYYNSLAGKGVSKGPLGRDSAKSSYINMPNGGGRLNYRFSPEWYNNTKAGTNSQYTQIDFT